MNVLTSKHQEALQQLREKLDEMNPEPVIEHLHENKALSVMQQLSLVRVESKTERSSTLVKIILEQQKEWVYQCMIDALKRSGQDDVLNLLGECKSVKFKLLIICML